MADVHPTISMPLSTAAYLSARFPVVASAGYLPARLKDKDGKTREGKFRYVDGGYFENSGTATVLDLLSALNIEDAVTEAGMDIQLIVIRIGADPKELRYQWHGLGEITSPVFAVVNAGTARGTLSVKEMETKLKEMTESAKPDSEFSLRSADEAHFQVNQTDVKLPLGYLLSIEARTDMDKQITMGANLDSFNRVIEALKRTQ